MIQPAKAASVKAAKMVEKARTQVVLRERFFATILMYMRVVVDCFARTMWTDGKTIGYNPDFIETLREDELVGVILHELLHIYFLHHLREGVRDHLIWNMACDYVINLVLVDAGYHLGEGALLDDKYKCMSAEEVYDILVKKIGQRSEPQLQPGTNQDSDCGDGQKGQKDQKNLAGQSGKETTDQGDSDDQVECDDQGDSDDSGNQSDKKKQPESKRSSLSDRLTEKEKEEATRGEVRALTNEGKELTESENDAAKAEMKKILAIAERASGMGSGSSRLLRELKENALVTEANWGRLIDYIAKLSHDESSWSYPHRRFIHSGQYLPSLRGRRSLGDIIIALDSSGSIDDDTWASYMASFRSLLEQYKIEKVTVIVCDDRIQGEVFQDIRPEEMEDIKNLGKGGTDFNPPFDWIDREGKNVDLLIYFTDLQCNRYPCDPGYPVVWTAWQSYSRNQIPPFGEVIRV